MTQARVRRRRRRRRYRRKVKRKKEKRRGNGRIYINWQDSIQTENTLQSHKEENDESCEAQDTNKQTVS